IDSSQNGWRRAWRERKRMAQPETAVVPGYVPQNTQTGQALLAPRPHRPARKRAGKVNSYAAEGLANRGVVAPLAPLAGRGEVNSRRHANARRLALDALEQPGQHPPGAD